MANSGVAWKDVNKSKDIALDKAIDFIEILAREPLLLNSNEIEMTISDLRQHARIELSSIQKTLKRKSVK